MQTIKDITKNTLLELKRKKLDATPNNYFVEFVNQARKVNFEDFENLKHIDELKKFIYNLQDILSPSIEHHIDEDINKLVKKLIKDPEKLTSRKTLANIKSITKRRIQNDKDIVKETTNKLLELSLMLGNYYEQNIDNNSSSINDISHIKEEIKDLSIKEISKESFLTLQNKLVDVTEKLEDTINTNNTKLLNNKLQFSKLEETIQSLQKQLNDTKEERDLDFLTNVLNRRSFEEEFEKIEEKFKNFEYNYAIIFYDIDHFKYINDTYGHDCGDAVLRTFAAILKKLTRENDIIARYGGEEFIVLLNYEKQKEVTQYIKRIKNLVKESEFVYKSNNIEVKFSAGLVFRQNHENHLDAVKKADELLYKAKSIGRDKIILENGIVI